MSLRVFSLIFISIIHLIRGELLSVSIIFRHGHRKPLSSYPKDPHSNFNWPEIGGLTDLGRSQIHELGTRLRKEYRSLLEKNEVQGFDNTLIRSSFLDRTKSSAHIFSHSFFNTNDSVPMTAIPFEEDNLILQFQKCPRYEAAKRQLQDDPPPEVLELLAVNSKVFKTLSKRTGKKINSVHDANFLFDVVLCESQYNLTQPDWTKEVDEVVRDVISIHLSLFTWTDFMKKAKAGPLITDLVNNMVNQIEHKTTKNIFVYSGHDLTLSTVTRSLGLYGQVPKVIAPSSALVFELHLVENKPLVQIRWFEPMKNESKDLYLGTCGTKCGFDQFYFLTKPCFIDDYEDFCRF